MEISFVMICRFQANLVLYQNLITKSLYDKQLDSGRGTLLHLSDDVIQQEVCCPCRVPKNTSLQFSYFGPSLQTGPVFFGSTWAHIMKVFAAFGYY